MQASRERANLFQSQGFEFAQIAPPRSIKKPLNPAYIRVKRLFCLLSLLAYSHSIPEP